jgi:hypothetical protein
MDLVAKLSGSYHLTKIKNSLRNLTYGKNWIAQGKASEDFCLINKKDVD